MGRWWKAFSGRRGFTLTEVMVALGLSSIVVGAGFALFVNSNRIYQSSGQIGRIQQTARAALELMASEIKMAGFGCVDQRTVPNMTNPESEVGFSPATANKYSNNASDVLQFKYSGGAMGIVDRDVSIPTGSGSVSLILRPEPGIDLLQPAMNVHIFTPDRLRIGTGSISSMGAQSVTVSMTKDPDFFDSDQIEEGSLVIQAPKYLTYMLDGSDRLVRCIRDSQAAPCVPGISGAGPDPDSYYVVAEGIKDIQFSYLLDATTAEIQGDFGCATATTNIFLPTTACHSNLSNIEFRRKIVGVKIEMLVKTDGKDPLIKPADCAADRVKMKYYLGDHNSGFDVSQEAEPCGHIYAMASTIVNLPNMFAYR